MTTSYYNDWLFRENPFSPRPLRADAIGNQLLIDRDDEVRRIVFRLAAGGAAVCLDGPVGVGKTSLSNVAAYRCQMSYLNDPQRNPLLIPCREAFQVSNDETPDQFRLRVLIEVAQTLLEKAAKFSVSLQIEGARGVDTWLNSPLLKQWSVGLPVLSGGGGVQANESTGYETSGFIKAVSSWLAEIFPEDRSGGIVCVLDNLELLETSAMARRKIEALRDTLFTIRGLKWILCGAHGIIQGVVSSQRLVGHLQEPIPVAPLALTQSQKVFEARVNTFRLDQNRDPYLPLGSDDFHWLYLIVHQNLRNTLAYSDEYCLSIAENGQFPSNPEEKTATFRGWLTRRALSIREAVKGHAGPRAMQLFTEVIQKFDGEFAPGDFMELGFKSAEALRPHVKTLEDLGLVEAQHDEADQRRKSIFVTGKGWLVHWSILTT